jgi:uncharacterized protein
MLYAVIFTDKPNHGHVRAAQLQAHIDWLEQHRDIIPVGGSLRRAADEVPKGGLWIAQAESKEQLDALIQTDPFVTSGLREGYEILIWGKANAARLVLI